MFLYKVAFNILTKDKCMIEIKATNPCSNIHWDSKNQIEISIDGGH